MNFAGKKISSIEHSSAAAISFDFSKGISLDPDAYWEYVEGATPIRLANASWVKRLSFRRISIAFTSLTS